MKIKGKVKFINKEKSNFFNTLRSRVDSYFAEYQISKNANASMIIKTIVLFLMFFLPFIGIMTMDFPFWANLPLWILMGISMAGIGMCVMHDANHGAYSNNKYVNLFVGHSLNLLGGAVFNWKLQHNILHHTYTNIVDMDEDIEDKLIMRFSPHTKTMAVQKFQVVYAFIFYGILTIYWAMFKDFVQFVKYTRNGVNTNSSRENVFTLIKIFITKVFYFSLMLGLPIAIFDLPAGQVIAGFLIMHYCAGLILGVVFQLAHTVEGTSHPLPDSSGNIENDWAIHQLNTTANFSRNNKILTWYLGGLNHQVEHHLFPRICHIHYPKIAVIVKQTAEEYGIPYLESPTFSHALKSHISTLKRFGVHEEF